MNNEDKQLKEEFFDYIHDKKYQGKNLHNNPSPETRERLKALEISQKYMVDEISEIKLLVKGLDTKLDCALEKKADKDVVKRLQDNLQWISYTVIGAVVLGVIGFVFFK